MRCESGTSALARSEAGATSERDPTGREWTVRLIKLKLTNFRRFAGEHALDLNEDLVALVGPNEAGKSSILRAIGLFGSLTAPDPADTTRGIDGTASISGLLVLDPDDREALAGIHEGDKVTHLWVTLTTGAGLSTWAPDPRPSRDLAPRANTRTLLSAIKDDPALDAEFSTSEEAAWEPERLQDVLDALSSRGENLPDDALSSLEDLAQRLRAIDVPPTSDEESATPVTSSGDEDPSARAASREATAAALVDLAAVERRPAPVQQVLNALNGRTPDVAYFDEADRDLQSDYRIEEVASDPPPALRNLCAIAGLDLSLVQADLTAGRTAHIESVFEKANATLKKRFGEVWTQSTVYPRLSTPLDGVMRVLISTEEADYSYPSERSDGLRWFLALHAFVVARGATDPILLVDEAETHLHYDAQADLIDALMGQRLASKVVYTTHSVGCLPPDLGSGIRAALVEPGAERSRVANSYWSVTTERDLRVGYTPLLFAMGAQLLPLTIPRYGVVAEGPSDAILLPTVLREASGDKRLRYRIVPGLSELAGDHVGSLKEHAGSVVCLTDDDDGGRDLANRLCQASWPPGRIVSLGRITPGCTLEDVVAARVFADAVNAELDTWAISAFRVDSATVPATGRWGWLQSQGEESGAEFGRLSKVRVAQRVVDLARRGDSPGSSRPVVDPAHTDGVRALHELLVEALGLPSSG